MGIDSLLARLTREAVTSVTPKSEQTLQEKTSDSNAVTPVTPVTPRKTDSEGRFRATPPKRAPNPPAPGGLVARLCEAGATVRTWSNGRGAMASIEAPAGIPAELVAEVEARGWRIAPGIKPNPEAEHDSWAFGGVPLADLDR